MSDIFFLPRKPVVLCNENGTRVFSVYFIKNTLSEEDHLIKINNIFISQILLINISYTLRHRQHSFFIKKKLCMCQKENKEKYKLISEKVIHRFQNQQYVILMFTVSKNKINKNILFGPKARSREQGHVCVDCYHLL